jgi:hypothetical protein
MVSPEPVPGTCTGITYGVPGTCGTCTGITHGVPGTLWCPRNPEPVPGTCTGITYGVPGTSGITYGVPGTPNPMVSPEPGTCPRNLHGNYIWCPRNLGNYIWCPRNPYIWCPRNPRNPEPVPGTRVPGTRELHMVSPEPPEPVSPEPGNYIWCPRNHGNAPIGAEPVPVQWTLLERLGPRCRIVRAEPQRERPFPVPHRVWGDGTVTLLVLGPERAPGRRVGVAGASRPALRRTHTGWQ